MKTVKQFLREAVGESPNTQIMGDPLGQYASLTSHSRSVSVTLHDLDEGVEYEISFPWQGMDTGVLAIETARHYLDGNLSIASEPSKEVFENFLCESEERVSKRKGKGRLSAAAKTLGHEGGKKGGPARARKLSTKRKKEIARKGANARWKKKG